jgi:hypothetical protein
LDLLADVVWQARQQTTTAEDINRDSKSQDTIHQILGNFSATLNDCESLLCEERYFMKHEGFVSRINYTAEIDPEVQRLRNKITYHTVEVRSATYSLRLTDITS